MLVSGCVPLWPAGWYKQSGTEMELADVENRCLEESRTYPSAAVGYDGSVAPQAEGVVNWKRFAACMHLRGWYERRQP